MPTSLIFFLAWRNLAQDRLRTLVSAISVALGTAVVVAADFVGAAIRRAGEDVSDGGAVPFVSEFLNVSLSLIGLIILLVAAFLIFNVFGMSVTQRRRQIGALRALGMTRGQIGRLLLAEAVLIGSLGAAAGAALGPLLGWLILNLLAAVAGVAHGMGTITAGNLLLAMLAGMGVTLLATAAPAARALAISPLAALRAATDEAPPWPRRRLFTAGALGLALTGLAPLYLIVDPPAARGFVPPWDGALTALFSLGWLLGWAAALPLILRGTRRAVLALNRRALSRLMADNLIRAQSRVILTILTLSLALLTITAVTGVTSFTLNVALKQGLANAGRTWVIVAMPPVGEGAAVDWGVLSGWDLQAMWLSPEFVNGVTAVSGDRATILRLPQVVVPELAILPGMPAYMADVAELRAANLFEFAAGDWATADPWLREECALLVVPRIAATLGAGVGDRVTVTGAQGPVSCVVAGIGVNRMMMGTSIVGQGAAADFDVDMERPFGLLVRPRPGADVAAVIADSQQLLADYPAYSLIELEKFLADMDGMLATLQGGLNGMLLLAIVAAALGVVNATVSGVVERRAELGLLRAVGGTRRQVLAVVVGEAGLLGLVGGAVGALAGLGLVVIFILVNGGNMYGLGDLDLAQSIRLSLPAAARAGLVGLVAAPLIAALAAYWPAVHFLRGAVINGLSPE
jgi:putative ABC transport system permease protein